MSAENSLEWNAEELLLQKIQAQPAFANQDIRHWTKDAKAEIETVVIKAERGRLEMESPGADETMTGLRATIIFASGTLTESEADAIAGAIVDAIYLQDDDFNAAIPINLPDITDAFFLPETNTERHDTKKLRKRTITVPLILKLIL